MTAEEIYRQQVKRLPPDEQIKLIALIAQELSVDQRADQESKQSLSALRGLGTEIWQGIDAQEYVDQLRNEWD